MIVLFFLLFAIETSCSVRTGDDTIFAADASSKILDDDPIFATIGCLCWADGHTGSLIIMHAGHWDEFGMDLRVPYGKEGVTVYTHLERVEKCKFCFHRIDQGIKEGKKIGEEVVPAVVGIATRGTPFLGILLRPL